jgi:hypothetical protein
MLRKPRRSKPSRRNLQLEMASPEREEQARQNGEDRAKQAKQSPSEVHADDGAQRPTRRCALADTLAAGPQRAARPTRIVP